MESELDILIAELQKEVNHLSEEQNACIRDRDYLGAHDFEIVLRVVRQKLRTACELKDPFQNDIAIYQRSLRGKDENFLKMFPQYQQRLDNLIMESNQYKAKKKIDSDELLTALNYLLEEKITDFELIFDEKPYYKISFDIINQAIQMTISRIKPANKKQIFSKYELLQLSQIGFERKEDKMIMFFQQINKTKTTKLLEIIARITFDAFRINGSKKAIIKYIM